MTWIQVGETIYDDHNFNVGSVSLNGDGSVLAVTKRQGKYNIIYIISYKQ